jgi:DNA (cytosine-5)-methyltransferase 1
MYEIASLFAGVGGIDLGFEITGKFKTVYANEFDPYASKTFEANFTGITVDQRDIHEVPTSEIPKTDVVIAGFPCQAFSIAGYRQGFDDKKGRGELFFELTRILEAHRPRVALFENVKNLVSHDKGNTFRVICKQLDILGYHYTYQVLNAMNYGNMAQNRERIYIVAFRDEADFANFHWPLSIPLTTTVKDIIDFEGEVDEKYYYTEGKYKGDIYKLLVEATQDDDAENPAIYQWRRKYVRQNKSGVVPTLTANQGEGGHNVCIVKTKYGLRKMTPRECFNAQGFPRNFILPKQSDTRLYKQAGNSVCVPVINRIAECILEAMDKTDQ